VLISGRRGVGLVVSLSLAANLGEYLFYECSVRHFVGVVDEVVDVVFDVVFVVVCFGDVKRGQLVLSLCSCPVASFDFTVRVFDDGEAFTVGRVVFDVPGHELILGHREDADIFGLAAGTDAIESLSWS
jgi:hypothetical protein